MPQFAANLMFMFQELPFYERFAAARACGFRLVEYQFPYDIDPEVIQDALQVNGLQMVLINAPCGDMSKNERGIGAFAERVGEFQDSIETALTYAEKLGVDRIHVMSGVVESGAEDMAIATYADNLRFAGAEAAMRGINILVEGINGVDIPGYLVQRSEQARAIIAMVGAQNVGMLYDAYHAQMNDEDPIEGIRAHFDVTGHVQVAGCPGRHEPDVAEIDLYAFFDVLDDIGYQGAVGCEYKPKTDTRAGLSWGSRYGLSAGAP